MYVGMVGINHKLANLRLRELLAKICHKRFGSGMCAHGDHHFILLSTCNRTELYFHSNDLTATHTYLLKILRAEVEEEFDQKLYSFFNYDCFVHLCRVTAGLDSAIVAETEIQGQVKVTYEEASAYQILPFPLHFLFQKALRVGKQVRTSFLQEGRGIPGLEDAILRAGLDLFKEIQQTHVLFVGASDINLKILAFLKRKGVQSITLCNRSWERAAEAAQTHQVNMLPWPCLKEWVKFNWAIFGTKAPEALVKAQDLQGATQFPRLLIDLSVPRNVDPHLKQAKGVHLRNIDQLNLSLNSRQQQMQHLLDEADLFIQQAAQRHLEGLASRTLKMTDASCFVA